MARPGSLFPGADPATVERALGDPIAALTFVKDVALLFKDCILDPRVPRVDKWVLAGVAAYLVSPIDLIPDAIPVLGQLDDLGLAVWALRRLFTSAGPELVTSLWRGSEDGLALVLGAAGLPPSAGRRGRTA